MIFDKVSRQRIYAAKGKALDVLWPAESEPRVGAKYSIQSSSKAGEYQLRVLSFRRQTNGIVATVKLEGDPVRLLARKAGYTDFDGRAMDAEEPEAVDDLTQTRFCRDAEHKEQLRRRVMRAEREELPLAERLRRVLEEAEEQGVDLSHQRLFLERRLGAMERKVRGVA